MAKKIKKKLSVREQIRRKLSSGHFEQKGGGTGGSYVRLEAGDNVIRILPPKSLDTENDFFYVERKRHYHASADNKDIICPRTEDMSVPCVVCSRASELMHGGSEDDAKEGRELSAVWRVYCNVVQLKKGETPGQAKLIDLARSLMRQILDFYDDDEYGDFWGKNAGRKGVAYDFVINRQGVGISTKYSVKPTKRFENVPNSSELLASITDLEDRFKVPSSDEAAAAFTGAEVDSEDEDDEEEEEVAPVKTRKSVKPVVVDDEDEDDEDVEEDDDDEDEDVAEEEDDDDEEEDEDDDDDVEIEDDDDDEEDDEDEDEDEDDDDEEEEEEPEPAPVVKKKRGRPPKIKVDPVAMKTAFKKKKK